MRILVVRLDHLGDVLLTTPLMRALAKAGHDVEALVRRPMDCLFENSPHVRRAWRIEDVSPNFPASWRMLKTWLLAQHYDAVLLPYARPWQLVRAAAASGAKIKMAMWGGLLGRTLGLRCLRSGMKSGKRHFTDMLLDLARDLGAKPDGTTPDFFLTEEERENARDALRMRFGGRPVIGIHPGNFGNSCNLSPKVYGEVASRMLAGGRCGVVATGTASEKKLTDSWPRDVQDHPLFWNATGQWDIRQLAAHIASFAGLIVPSTGPLHIASALGIPAVSPFCASPSLSHVVWGGLSAGSVHLTPDAAYCRDRRKHHKGHCDFGGAISADKICDAAFRLAHLTEKYE